MGCYTSKCEKSQNHCTLESRELGGIDEGKERADILGFSTSYLYVESVSTQYIENYNTCMYGD
jgi:hypothetical protein